MASYLDQLPKFREYVPYMDPEAVAKVGAFKQQKYEENVQKIQDQIDKIAGLEIYKPLHKQYLQSKLDELGGNLRTYAAGDFSNFQLVNSVSGMTKQIVNDPVIQNAVFSTAKIKEEQGIMKEASKKGESSEANIWDFNESVNAYYNSKDINESFNGRYKPYRDVNKKWMETLKTLHPSLAEYDLPYEQNADGSPNYDKIAAAMSRITKETVSAPQIENAIRSSLSPDDIEQLSIDGRYRFRGYSKSDLQNYKKNQYESLVKYNDEQIDFLKKYSQTVTSDPKEYNASLKAIKDREDFRERLNENYSNQLKLIDQNPDAVKAEIYKDGAITQFANAFSWETNKKQILDNPVLKSQQWERTFALDQSKYWLSVRSQNWNEYKDKFDMDMKEKTYQLELKKLNIDLYGAGSTFTTYTGESTDIKSPQTAMINDMNQKLSVSDAAVRQMAVSMGTTPELLEVNIDYYQRGQVNKIPAEWREKVDEIVVNRQDANRISKALKKIDEDIEKDPNFTQKKKEIDKELSTLKPIKIGNTTFSQKEILDYLTKIKGGTTGLFGGFGSIFNEELLTDKEKILHKSAKPSVGIPAIGAARGPAMLVNSIFGVGGSSELTKQVNDQLFTYNKVLDQSGKINAEMMVEKNNRLEKISGVYVPMSMNINVTDKSRPFIEGIATAILNRYSKDRGGAENLDVEGAQKLFDKDKNLNFYRKVVQGDKTYLSVSREGTEYLIPVTDTEASQLPSYEGEPTSLQKRATRAQYMNNGSTSIPLTEGVLKGTSYDGFFTSSNFKNVKKLQPFGNLQWNHSNNSVNYLTIGINTPYGPKNLKIDDYPMDADAASKFVSQLTDQHIVQLFLSNPGTKDDQEIIKTLRSLDLIK